MLYQIKLICYMSICYININYIIISYVISNESYMVYHICYEMNLMKSTGIKK